MYKNTLAVFIIALSSSLILSGCSSSQSDRGYQQPNNIIRNKQGVPNYYKVRKGDTLSGIADKYRLSYRQIGKLNQLDNNYTIFANQWIVLWGDKKSRQSVRKSDSSDLQNKTQRPNLRTQTINKPDVSAIPIKNSGSYIPPTRNRILKNLGEILPNGKVSTGILYAGYEGDPVYASQEGVVLYTGAKMEEFGNLVMIMHANDFVSIYAHNSQIHVQNGERVIKGQKIASMGKTGNTNQVGLQFQIRKNKQVIDPLSVLK